MRSFLFVPGDSERKLAKGPSSGPDGLILDLEDSVATDRKTIARDMALAYLKSANRAGPKLYVRVNALDTGLTLGDLAVVMQGKPDGIVFPKCVGQANLDLLATLPRRPGSARRHRSRRDQDPDHRHRKRGRRAGADGGARQACPTDRPLVGRRGSDGRPRRARQGPLARRLRRHLQARAHRQPDGVGGGRRHRLRHRLSRHQERRRPARRGDRCAAHGLWRQDRHPSRPGRDHP